MLKKLQYFWQLSYQRSPQVNLTALRRKLDNKLNSNEQSQFENKTPSDESNTVIPDIWNKPIYQELTAYKLHLHNKPVVLLGELNQVNALAQFLTKRNIVVRTLEWDWESEINSNDFSQESQLIICKIPLNEHHWQVIQQLKKTYLERCTSIYELVLPFTLVPMAQSSLNYYVKTLEEISPYYLGENYFGPINKLNEVFPLSGKKVIEFGPFDGCQTAGLLNSGVKTLTCIEARAENAIKILVARYVFDWNNLELMMDDFHNANQFKYGTYDLAFAHGVYYHSIAPFLFLENLRSLSENIFIGGFCATESSPEGDYETLEYEGEKYRVKRYKEADYFTAGVNPIGYFFHKDDLMKFFKQRNYEVIVISDEDAEIAAGNYLRFLACKK
ncbi:hypothetical protein NDI39_05180 [Microcoleus sp. ZQ-A2]|nr:hypothetical protein [Microcoleus sp. FACHB-1]